MGEWRKAKGSIGMGGWQEVGPQCKSRVTPSPPPHWTPMLLGAEFHHRRATGKRIQGSGGQSGDGSVGGGLIVLLRDPKLVGTSPGSWPQQRPLACSLGAAGLLLPQRAGYLHGTLMNWVQWALKFPALVPRIFLLGLSQVCCSPRAQPPPLQAWSPLTPPGC